MTQVAVKLPDHLLNEIDALVSRGLYPSRSSAIRTALEAIVVAERRGVIDAAFAEGYSRVPESEDELAEASRLAIKSIHDEPWEPWW